MDQKTELQGLSRKAIEQELDNSLDRLGMETVDLYQTHRWDADTPIDVTMGALDDAVRRGKARYVGASSMWAHQFADALHTSRSLDLERFQTMQNHYNLLYREEEREMLPLYEKEDVGVLPWSPLPKGYLARPHEEYQSTTRRESNDYTEDHPYFEGSGREVNERVEQLADERGVTMAGIATAWLLDKEHIDAPIVETTSVEHLEEAVAALDVRLSDRTSSISRNRTSRSPSRATSSQAAHSPPFSFSVRRLSRSVAITGFAREDGTWPTERPPYLYRPAVRRRDEVCRQRRPRHPGDGPPRRNWHALSEFVLYVPGLRSLPPEQALGPDAPRVRDGRGGGSPARVPRALAGAYLRQGGLRRMREAELSKGDDSMTRRGALQSFVVAAAGITGATAATGTVSAAGTTYYVDGQNGDNSNGGTSKNDAWGVTVGGQQPYVRRRRSDSAQAGLRILGTTARLERVGESGEFHRRSSPTPIAPTTPSSGLSNRCRLGTVFERDRQAD